MPKIASKSILQDAKCITEFKKALSPQRKELLSLLLEKGWFKKTNFKLQKKLLTLPNDWDGYLSDLSKREDEVGGMDVLKMIGFKRGDFVGLSRFQVRVQQTNEVINYGEYVTSKYGGNPGFRGILLLEVDGEVKYFVIKKSEKFPVGKMVYDTLGGMVQYKHGRLANLSKKVEIEIKRQLGLNKLPIKRFIDLGQMHTDVGRSSNHVSLFAAVVDINDAPNLNKLKNHTISKTKRIKFDVLIEPIERINEFIHKVDDSFFLACVSRLLSTGVIKLN